MRGLYRIAEEADIVFKIVHKKWLTLLLGSGILYKLSRKQLTKNFKINQKTVDMAVEQ